VVALSGSIPELLLTCRFLLSIRMKFQIAGLINLMSNLIGALMLQKGGIMDIFNSVKQEMEQGGKH
jgi:hypothetical protein